MRTRTYSLIGAIALAWAGAGAASDAAKAEPAGPLDPARVQSAGSGATGESGISESHSAGAVKEGEEVRASRDAASHDDQHAKDGSGDEASGQREDDGPATMPQGEGDISSDSLRN